MLTPDKNSEKQKKSIDPTLHLRQKQKSKLQNLFPSINLGTIQLVTKGLSKSCTLLQHTGSFSTYLRQMTYPPQPSNDTRANVKNDTFK